MDLKILFPVDDTVIVVASTRIIDAEQTLMPQVKYIDWKVERGTERRGPGSSPRQLIGSNTKQL